MSSPPEEVEPDHPVHVEFGLPHGGDVPEHHAAEPQGVDADDGPLAQGLKHGEPRLTGDGLPDGDHVGPGVEAEAVGAAAVALIPSLQVSTERHARLDSTQRFGGVGEGAPVPRG